MNNIFKKIGEMDECEGISIREIILRQLRNAIFSNLIKPGERLIENSIAQAMGVSRTPVREALRQLESEGLATNIPRKGAVVKGICCEDAMDIYDIREVLEGLAARGACLHISRIEIRELREIITMMETCIKNNEEEEYVKCHDRFNKIILNSCKNKRLVVDMEYIYEYLKSLRKVSLLTSERRISALKEHTEIVDAIEVGDDKLAETITREHIRNAKISFEKAMKL
ncbi:MAG: GntR family transcriptional regulator [Clostridium sp.]|uniref:GntR family transcriptional regulator n=1 Tax=Clostridium sp. TaxID=1506 RepID=UPI0030633AC1